MESSNTALAVFTSSDLKADKQELARLQQCAIEQFNRMIAIRHEETIRGLMLGLTLLRIKTSLPYGEFGNWLKTYCNGYSERWSHYLMRLAMVFAVRSRVTKPMMLALPGDQTELVLDSLVGAQRAFMEKALKFCGELSISELLNKHGIKETKKLGGARERRADDEPPPSPESLANAKRAELAQTVETLRQQLLIENLPVAAGLDPADIRALHATLDTILTRWSASIKHFLN